MKVLLTTTILAALCIGCREDHTADINKQLCELTSRMAQMEFNIQRVESQIHPLRLAVMTNAVGKRMDTVESRVDDMKRTLEEASSEMSGNVEAALAGIRKSAWAMYHAMDEYDKRLTSRGL